jgi:hypothetical protein
LVGNGGVAIGVEDSRRRRREGSINERAQAMATQDRQDLRLPQEVVLVVERGISRVSELNGLISS